MSNYKHWKVEQDASHILWLGLDRQDAAINTINDEVLDELNGLLHEIAKNNTLTGLVIHSLKEKGFIAGADINTFAHFKTPAETINFLRKGQVVFSYLENLPIPTVAIINGFCMGGGLELALACHYRIATDEKETRLGLPEILLGIHPGWGGTVRLPRLIGGFNALTQVILTGAALSASRAKQLGIVDDIVPLRQLKRAANYFIQKKPEKHKPGLIESASNCTWIRPLIAALLRKKLALKIRESHYPAPFAVIHLWEKEAGFDERAYLKEADSVEQLVTKNNTATHLIRSFLLRERLKGFSKKNTYKVHRVHVIGAGVMGGDIAAWCALRGLTVTLQDKSYEQIAPAIKRAHQLFTKKLKKPRPIQAAMDHLIPDPTGEGIAHADVIIEAVFENALVKQTIFRAVEVHAKKDAIIATNTSSIPLEEISQVMQDPHRLIGIHFFNPVAKMALVEVVSSIHTKKEIVEQASAFVNQLDRLPLPVKSSPGFLVNRVLMPYLMECVQLLEDGFSPETIDEAALAFGMLMGPVELVDTVGMDVCLAVAENLTAHFGGLVPKKLTEMVQAKKLGRKTGEGFYCYQKGKPIKNKEENHPKQKDIAERLIFRMLNEATACLKEGVVTDADLIDAGMIFGTGFAPFRGGPMHYAKELGPDSLKERRTYLIKHYGERFKAPD